MVDRQHHPGVVELGREDGVGHAQVLQDHTLADKPMVVDVMVAEVVVGRRSCEQNAE